MSCSCLLRLNLTQAFFLTGLKGKRPKRLTRLRLVCRRKQKRSRPNWKLSLSSRDWQPSRWDIDMSPPGAPPLPTRGTILKEIGVLSNGPFKNFNDFCVAKSKILHFILIPSPHAVASAKHFHDYILETVGAAETWWHQQHDHLNQHNQYTRNHSSEGGGGGRWRSGNASAKSGNGHQAGRSGDIPAKQELPAVLRFLGQAGTTRQCRSVFTWVI